MACQPAPQQTGVAAAADSQPSKQRSPARAPAQSANESENIGGAFVGSEREEGKSQRARAPTTPILISAPALKRMLRFGNIRAACGCIDYGR